MQGFKDFVNQPAIVKQQNVDLIQELQRLKRGAQQAFVFIQRAVGIFSIDEAARHVKYEVDNNIISAPAFRDYMKKNFNAEPQQMGGSFQAFSNQYQHSCGDDGCAYFFSNQIVVKFSSDAKEMKIAESVAGLLSRLPIMAAFEIEVEATESVTYAIIMRKLDTSHRHDEAYSSAYGIFSAVLDRLMEIVKKKPDVSVEYIRKRLSVAYMAREDGLSPGVRPYMEDLVRAIRAIYIRSGYLLGADWTERNLGFTKKGHIQPFDFGRAYNHPPAQETAPKVQRQTLLIPKPEMSAFMQWQTKGLTNKV